MTDTDTQPLVHKWERANLGKAPFRCVGMYEKTFQAHPGAPVQAGGSCDYCGNGIRYCFKIRSADGKEFKVGSDCVLATNSKGTRVLTETQRLLRDHKRDKAAAKLALRIDAVKAALAADPTLLTDQKHPNGFEDKNLRDWAEWMLRNAGATGRTYVCNAVERTLKAKEAKH